MRQEPPEGGEFERGAHQAADAGPRGKGGQPFDMRLDVGGKPKFSEGCGIEARQNRDGKDEGRGLVEALSGFARGRLRRLEHRAATAGVHGEHLHVEVNGGGDRLGDGIRDVVEFQIKEDGGAERANSPHNIRACGCEEFLADLEGPYGGAQPMGERQGSVCGGDIESDDDRIVHGAGD